MKKETNIPITEMKQSAIEALGYANGYYKMLIQSLTHKSHFDNNVLYGVISLSFEKFMIALLYSYNEFAMSHVPTFLFNEARSVEDRLTEEMFETSKLIGSFESICTFDGFGYHIPNNTEIRSMVLKMRPISELANLRIKKEI
jgi:hypothetical protein